jgi:hypothetical protein
MKKINLITITAVLFGLVFAASFSYGAEEKDQELKLVNRTVTIITTESARDDMKPVVDPVNLNSAPGTTVIWVNFSKTPVELLFLDKKVTTACGSPVNFFVGKGGAYESAKIPFGGTASLCFLEKGKFEYMVNTSSTFYPSKMKEQRGFIWIE